MRRRGFAIAVLVGALTGPVRAGSADEPIDPDEQAEPRLPTVQLVQAWPKTKQALLYDPIQGTYVVVAAGQNVDGFRVSRIGKNQIVLSTIGGAARDYVLLPTPVADLPDSAGTPPKAPPAVAPTAPPDPPKPAAPDLIDPYPAGMLDPYGAEGVRVVDAPPQSKAVPGAPVPATTGPAPTATVTTGPATKPPVPGKPAATKPTKPIKPAAPAHSTPPPPAPAVAKTPPAPTPAAAPTPGTVVLDKKDLNDALADFATLTKDSRLTLGPSGVSFAHVATGSLFARVGLRDGDRVVTINGSPIRSVDDAADLYAQLGGMKQLSLDVVRGSGHVTLRADLR